MSNILRVRTIDGRNKGCLSFLEEHLDIPFNIKRIYYTYNVPVDTIRGMHAHKKLNQIIWCPYGKIEILLDDGVSKNTYDIHSPEMALFVPKGIWHEMKWKKEGSVLCAIASDYYDETDYIREYQEFIRLVHMGYWCDND